MPIFWRRRSTVAAPAPAEPIVTSTAHARKPADLVLDQAMNARLIAYLQGGQYQEFPHANAERNPPTEAELRQLGFDSGAIRRRLGRPAP